MVNAKVKYQFQFEKKLSMMIFILEMADESQNAYTDAFDIAKNQMPVIHPIRLGLVLNFSVFYFEILNEVDVACRLAKQVG